MSTTIIINGDPTEETWALIARLTSAPLATESCAAVAPALPSIPKTEPTERYAGVMLDEDGKPSHHLFLLNAKTDKRMKWKEAVEWAAGLGAGVSLPTRFEIALLYANLQSQFDTGAWYWTSTQYSEGGAWNQGFDNGGQYVDDKSCEGRARAVRRLSTSHRIRSPEHARTA